ncbi:hypothetical protein KC348_g9162, partial [Hortaea werneckii]
MKPFRPPTLVNKTPSNSHRFTSSEPPQKKRRICDQGSAEDDVEVTTAAANALRIPKPVKRFQSPAPRKSDEGNQNVFWLSQVANSENDVPEAYYNVLWRKFTMKKNKTWDGDGVLSVRGGYATLQDISGKELGKAACKGLLMIGSELSIGGKDVEVESMISKDEFLAGRPFLGSKNRTVSKPFPDKSDRAKSVENRVQAKPKQLADTQKEKMHVEVAASQASRAGFRAPLLKNTVQTPSKDAPVPVPRHNPNASEALVMKRPKSAPKGKQIVDVVVDPQLTSRLREHQRIGVSFLYECVMGMKDYAGEGAILADEMGLGKTLQTIALLWTLMKQNPIYGDSPVVKKALIVCPVTLITNWKKEIHKWLSKDKVGVFVAENKKNRLTDFTHGKCYNIMIVGYEKLRMIQEDLQKATGIDIVIADEGHRLKTAQNKSALAIKSLNTERRIILSGTPIQNDLAEFYTMVDFVNPGLLNKYSTFKREFETPILKSQQPG